MRIFMMFCLQIGLGLGGVGCAPAASPGGSGGSSGGSGGAGSSSGGLGNSETGVGTGGMPTGTGGGDSTAGVGASGTGEVGTSGMSETGASSSTGCSFICETTDGHDPHGCNNFAQDCPEGQKCAAWADGGGGSWNAVKCVPVMGNKQPGEPCFAPEGGTSGLDDCAKGVMCWNVDENKVGECVALCSGSPEAPMCPDKDTCTIAAEGWLNLCIIWCDPLIQDCENDESCIPNGDNFVCVPDASGEEGQANDACEVANGCDKGLVCLDTAGASSACDPGAAGCCQPFCEFPDGVCPNPDQACVQWYDPMMLPPDDPKLKYGVCAIPG